MSRLTEINRLIDELKELAYEELTNSDNVNDSSIEVFVKALNRLTDSLISTEEEVSVNDTKSSIYASVDMDQVMFLVGAGGLAVPIGGSNVSNNNDGDDS
jgi:hypothetical protein